MNTSRMLLRTFTALCLALPLALGPSLLPAEETVIKFATLAPEGSTWMKVMQEWNKALMEKTGNQVKFRMYQGGVSGDEKDVVRKIRLGQLQAGGFTGVGLGEIAPEVRVMDAPLLFQSSDEVDYVLHTFNGDFEQAFQKNGYVLLGWAEVGFVYFFTAKPVKDLKDLKSVKMWMWEGDPIAEAAFKALGASPIPLSIADVMTSLQTGLIDGVYSSPLAMVALQWFTRTKYMYNYSFANAMGAVLISKKAFDKLPKDQQDILLATGKEYLGKLTRLSREENKTSIEALKKNGVTILPAPSAQDVAQYHAVGEQARKALVGKLYSQEFLSRIEKSIQDYRASKKK